MDSANQKIDIREYVLGVVEGICEFPKDIELEVSTDDRGVLLQLFCHKDDLGRLIGKKGDTVNAIRALLRVVGTRNEARYSFKVDELSKK